MDNDEYQRIVEYENEIYDLYHEGDQKSDSSNSADVPMEKLEHNDSDSEQSSTISNPKYAAATANLVDSNQSTEEQNHDFSDSASLSEDERDLIYSRLYHSTSTLPTKNNIRAEEAIPSTKSSMSGGHGFNTEYTVPSINFTFELDMDKLQPSLEAANPFIETTPLDDDDDFAVYILHRAYINTLACKSRSLFRTSGTRPSLSCANNLLSLQSAWAHEVRLSTSSMSLLQCHRLPPNA